jgi:hypothetical protein
VNPGFEFQTAIKTSPSSILFFEGLPVLPLACGVAASFADVSGVLFRFNHSTHNE